MRKRHRRRALQIGQSVIQTLEPLEGRVLMATAREIFNVGNIDTSAPTSPVITNTKDGPMSNVGGRLVDLYLDYRRFRKAGGLDVNYKAPESLGLWVVGNKVGITVRGTTALPELTEKLRSFGAVIVYRTGTFNAIDALLPVTMLHEAALDPTIASVNPIAPPKTSHEGSANNQADEAMVTDIVRSTFGVSGVGVKIGVISTSINLVGTGLAGSIASGDLPSDVQVLTDMTLLQDTNGTLAQDEGRAMLELIHDMAPDADLAFATGVGGQQVFADAVRALRAAGCDIIVDDLRYFSEPFFQPGIIDQAISDVVASGAIYVTSAGNDADAGYETPVTFTPGPGPQLVDWNSGPNVDTRLRVNLDASAIVRLQWDNPFNGIAGNVSTDLDIYAFDPVSGTKIRAFGTANNLRTGVPVEEMVLPAGTYDLQIRVADTITGKPLPTRIKFVLTGGVGLSQFTPEYAATPSSIYGHGANPDVISVGAVPYFNAPPFSAFNPIFSEDFTSTGPVTHVFDASGNRLATPRVILKPDISGVDSTNTSFFTGLTELQINALKNAGLWDQRDYDDPNDADILPNFAGTSAAAPNVVGVLALLRQAAPDATLNELAEILRDTATPLNGAVAGSFDPRGGYGLVNAFAAIEPFVSAPTIEDIIVDPDPSYGNLSEIRIVFSQQVSGFTIADLKVSKGDEGINLLTGNQQLVQVDGGKTYRIVNIDDLIRLNGPGVYLVEFADSEGDIANPLGLQLVGTASKTFESLPPPQRPAAPSGTATKAINQTTVRVRWVDNSGLFESGFQIERSEDPAFLSRVKRININQRDVTVYTDTDSTIAGKKLYYRVRAFNALGQFSAFSEVSTVTTPSNGEIILDNESGSGVTISGTWDVSDDTAGFLGNSYLDDLNSGKGTNSVKFTPNITTAGDYYVYARWTTGADRATNVPVDVNSSSGKKTFTLNQRNSGGAGWVLIGKFSFKAGSSSFVEIRTGGTNGKVIVDAVRFLSATGA